MIKEIKNKKGFTLIELLVVIAVIAILSAVVVTSLTSSKEKAKVAAAKSIASNLTRQLEVITTSDSKPKLLVPNNPSTGDGPICSSCTSTATWPSLAKTGYVYSVLPDDDISTGSSLFRIIKPLNTETVIEPSIVNDPNETILELSAFTDDLIFTFNLDNGMISMEEIMPLIDAPATLAVGDSYGGGIIAYVGKTSLIISSNSDQGTANFSYLCPGSSGPGNNPPGGGGIPVGGGGIPPTPGGGGSTPPPGGTTCAGGPSLVTDLINTYNSGGSDYSDWYLPSKDELEKLLNNHAILGLSTNTEYWSSTSPSSLGEGYWTGSVDSNGNITWQVEPSGWSAVVHLIR